MGKPTGAILQYRALNQIGVRRERPELKHLSRGRKRHQPRFHVTVRYTGTISEVDPFDGEVISVEKAQ